MKPSTDRDSIDSGREEISESSFPLGQDAPSGSADAWPARYETGLPHCALVLGDYRQSISIARSLHRAGLRVVLGSSRAPSSIVRSRHVADFWRHPDQDADPTRFRDALLAFSITAPEPLVIFPVGDREVAYFAANGEAVPLGAVAVMPSALDVDACLNKSAQYRAAREVGLSVADFELTTTAELDAAVAHIGYPCVIKPVSSLDDPAYLKAFVLPQAPTGSSVSELVERSGLASAHVLVQRRVDGIRHNCHFVADRGRMLAYFEQRVLRTTRLDGAGSGVDGISVPPSPVRRLACARLAERLAYSGPGCIQFLVDERTDCSWFLELNPRLDATCAIAEYCGYDLPLLALEEALHRSGLRRSPQPLPGSYAAGVRAVWSTGDLKALMLAAGRGRIGPLAAAHWLLCAIRSFLSADRHLMFRWSDPVPALFAMADITFGTAWRAAKRMASGSARMRDRGIP